MHRLFGHPWGWASFPPLVCAIHCAITPILVVLAPTLAPGEAIEWALLGFTALLAGGVILVGASRHGDLGPAWPIGLGMAAWTASLLHVFHPVPEEPTTILAALTVATGLLWNSRIHCAGRADRALECPGCRTEGEEVRHEPPALSGTRPLPTLEG